MNHTQILKRAWKILWNYRALWVIGFILAFTGGSSPQFNWQGSGPDRSNNDGNHSFFTPPDDIIEEFNRMGEGMEEGMKAFFTGFDTQKWIMWGIIIGLIILTLLVISTFLNYISKTSLIKAVDLYEENEEKLKWTKVFRLGWSRTAWKLFLIDLVVSIPFVMVIIAFLGCAALPIFLTGSRGGDPSSAGIIFTVGSSFLVIFFAIFVGLVINLLLTFAYRICALENTGVFESISQGWKMVRRKFKDIGIMWLIILGIRVGTGIAIFIVVFAMLIISGLIGGGIGFLIYSLSSSVIAAAITGGIIFFFIMFTPLVFIEGLREVYFSTSWTLTYRELITTDLQDLEPMPELEGSDAALIIESEEKSSEE
ncbi:MAG: hypothetical protein JEZ06_06815 [Anaerolineaceae bacterium]|nr:hypothetical protein [Anaerolineaceae bacterium]